MKSKTTLLGLAVLTLTLIGAPKAFAYDDDQPYCREYTQDVRVGGRLQRAYGVACLKPDGAWEIITREGHSLNSPSTVYLGPAVQPPRFYQPVIYRYESRPLIRHQRPIVISFPGDRDDRHDRRDHHHGRGRGHDRHRD